MMPTNYTTIHLLFAELLLVTFAVLVLFWLRTKIGRGGLFSLSGLLIAWGAISEEHFSQHYKIMGYTIEINSGACISYPALLYIVLLIYLSQRRVIGEIKTYLATFAAMYVFMASILLLYCCYPRIPPDAVGHISHIFSFPSAASQILGFMLLVFELVVMLVVYERLHTLPFFFRFSFVLTLVLSFDAVAYPSVRWCIGQQPIGDQLVGIFLGHGIAAQITAIVFSIGICLARYVDPHRDELFEITRADSPEIPTTYATILELLPLRVADLIAAIAPSKWMSNDRIELLSSLKIQLEKSKNAHKPLAIVVIRVSIYDHLLPSLKTRLLDFLNSVYPPVDRLYVTNAAIGEMVAFTEDSIFTNEVISDEIVRLLSADLADILSLAGSRSDQVQIGRAIFKDGGKAKKDALELLKDARRNVRSYMIPISTRPLNGSSSSKIAFSSASSESLPVSLLTSPDVYDDEGTNFDWQHHEPNVSERLLEEFEGRVERLDGEHAYITLTNSTGDSLSGIYQAAELDGLGIGELDRFRLQTFGIANQVTIKIAKLGRRTISLERQQEIEELNAKRFSDLDLTDDY